MGVGYKMWGMVGNGGYVLICCKFLVNLLLWYLGGGGVWCVVVLRM